MATPSTSNIGGGGGNACNQIALNLIGWRAPVKSVLSSGNDWPVAEIIQTKPAVATSSTLKTSGGELRDSLLYYVHWIEFNKRLDEWVEPSRIDFANLKPPVAKSNKKSSGGSASSTLGVGSVNSDTLLAVTSCPASPELSTPSTPTTVTTQQQDAAHVNKGGRSQQTVKHKSLQGSPIGVSVVSTSRKRKNSNTFYDDSHGGEDEKQSQLKEAMIVEEAPSTEGRPATPEQQMKIPRTSGWCSTSLERYE